MCISVKKEREDAVIASACSDNHYVSLPAYVFAMNWFRVRLEILFDNFSKCL